MNKNIKILFLVFLLIISFLFVSSRIKNKKNKEIEEDIKLHYSSTVVVNNATPLYIYDDNEYIKIGLINKDEIIHLEEKNITIEDKYFKIKEFDNSYYIKYQDVSPTKNTSKNDKRYQKYIPFNENIITKNNTKFYNQDDKLIYSLNKQLSLPIIIKYENSYGVIYNDKLLKVKKEDVKEVTKSSNTDIIATDEIAVLNYHFFYDETKESERKDCNQIICHSKSLFSSHLKYIKDNKIFTPTMEEYELWYDKKINLPKSVLITIDDGWRMQQGIDLLEEYKINGTVFLITSWFKDEIKFLHDYNYVEFHSHGDNLHSQGKCPGGQGGAIKCLDKSKLLDDLALSRKKLEGSHYFCYPFYEYNNYSINALKEAGFTMSFAGGFRRSKSSDNRYAIPRYVVYNSTSAADIGKYIG